MIDLDGIYREYKNKVLGYVNNKVRNMTVAEDICSDVFLKVTAAADRFDETKASVSTWIYTIMRNTLNDYYRTNHEGVELDDNMASDEDVDAKVCNDEMLETLADALEKLDLKERTVIVRHYYKNEKLTDIAEEMGISYSYAKLLHGSALKKMKKYFKD